MANSQPYVRARIDEDTKARATEALRSMGLSMSEAIRLMLERVANEHRLPFAIDVPNAETIAAMQEARAMMAARQARFSTSDALFHALDQGKQP